MALTDKLTAIADAIRGKTGKTDGLTLDQMPTEIEGIQSGGGEEVYFTPYGVGYTPNVVLNCTELKCAWQGADNLKSLALPEWNPTSATVIQGGVTDLFASASLESLILPKLQFGSHYWARNATALKTVQLGSIGYSVTSMGLYFFRFCTQAGLTITVYVDAATLEDIASNVITTAPWSATNATIIYRNSTTGEVITE